ncbi:MAG: hypothetical protein ABIS18_05260 [Actinomycetota bacterium]
MLVDATGVGDPIVDLLRQALLGRRCRVIAVKFTGTERLERGPKLWDVRMGKACLVSRMQVLLQTNRIELPDTPEARDLVDELVNYELRVTDNANVTAGAFRTGTHDDLATALGLAVLMDRKTHPTYELVDPGSM